MASQHSVLHNSAILVTQNIPDDKSLENVTPIYTNGQKENPGSVSLTSVLGKVMEQSILSAIAWQTLSTIKNLSLFTLYLGGDMFSNQTIFYVRNIKTSHNLNGVIPRVFMAD
ncbi:hypothetical protein WISP_110972 [Willisornis vidua]|uniref:Uncharacterized protein n=1 Tax=Willisornis vidua TaxID=1566151 RepID=A0ABQ9D0M8_9PASS|nr:hypothetical protein WISP_110972 [Willisornis vidua]